MLLVRLLPVRWKKSQGNKFENICTSDWSITFTLAIVTV